MSIASPLMQPSPNGRRVGIRIVTIEACSGFTHVTARRIAQPPKATFVARLRPGQLPDQVARQLPDLSTIIRVRPSSTDDSRLRGALPTADSCNAVRTALAIPSLLPSPEFLASRIPSGGLRGTTLRAATRRDCATHHGHALGISDKLSRLLVRLHQSENCLQPRDHITGLQKVLLLSDVAREDSGDGICQCARLFALLQSVVYGS